MTVITHPERWTIWSLPGTRGQRVVQVDGRVPAARERIEVVPASQFQGAVDERTREIVAYLRRLADANRAGPDAPLRTVASMIEDHFAAGGQ